MEERRDVLDCVVGRGSGKGRGRGVRVEGHLKRNCCVGKERAVHGGKVR
jgi:hypothetical protein